jgi:hypothetical protein
VQRLSSEECYCPCDSFTRTPYRSALEALERQNRPARSERMIATPEVNAPGSPPQRWSKIIVPGACRRAIEACNPCYPCVVSTLERDNYLSGQRRKFDTNGGWCKVQKQQSAITDAVTSPDYIEVIINLWECATRLRRLLENLHIEMGSVIPENRCSRQADR